MTVIATLTFASGVFAFAGKPGAILGIPVALFAGLAFMTVLTLSLLMLCLFFPKVRATAEGVAVGNMVVFLAGWLTGTDGRVSASDGWMIVMLIGYLTFLVYGTPMLDRYLPRRGFRFRSVARSRLRPDQLWPHVATTPDSGQHYRKSETLALEWIEEGVVFRESTRVNDVMKLEETKIIEIFSPPTHIFYRFAVDGAEGADGASGTVDHEIAPHPDGSRLATIRNYDRVTWRQALFVWLDDTFGRDDDKAIRQAERAG